MKIQAKGQLRHMFHGSYGCMIALQFDSQDLAKDALTVLKGWEQSTANPDILIGQLDSEALEAFKSKHAPKGNKCPRKECKGKSHEIDGINHSIDIGPPFTVEFNVNVNDPNQLSLGL